MIPTAAAVETVAALVVAEAVGVMPVAAHAARVGAAAVVVPGAASAARAAMSDAVTIVATTVVRPRCCRTSPCH